jgi:hypothetical protein
VSPPVNSLTAFLLASSNSVILKSNPLTGFISINLQPRRPGNSFSRSNILPFGSGSPFAA